MVMVYIRKKVDIPENQVRNRLAQIGISKRYTEKFLLMMSQGKIDIREEDEFYILKSDEIAFKMKKE